jgi:hypothetical protein
MGTAARRAAVPKIWSKRSLLTADLAAAFFRCAQMI